MICCVIGHCSLPDHESEAFNTDLRVDMKQPAFSLHTGTTEAMSVLFCVKIHYSGVAVFHECAVYYFKEI